ncbi:FMN-binding protein [Kineococcus rubinsiae]|uniref:FMN-binding protein n=1 Tax=Kineococcus rubinsiae TaxID=2609562 RepID=UPI0014310EA4|nr:FMN-binding protein [Kineococcus rubinsiae]NIZ92264.1 FMN-binding protein [Kineococcus rubinsiae]
MSTPVPEARRRRRLVVTGMSTLTALVLLFGYHTSTDPTASAGTVAVGTAVAGSGSTSSGSTGSGSTSSGSTSSGSTGSGSASSGSAAGTTTVTGDAADTRWGPVQVRITTDGSTITAVDVVEFPTGNGRDQEINAYAVPELVQETLSAQSADIDMVSGATVTSTGYLQSLQSALDQAGL